MSYNLFLDDVRTPKQVTWVKLPDVKWMIVRNFDEFKKAIETHGIPDRVAFDHDLADDHYNLDNSSRGSRSFSDPTGYDCAKWLVRFCQDNKKQFPQYWIHSMNPVGAKNIDSYIKSFKKSLEKDTK